MTRPNVGKYIKEYLDCNPEIEIKMEQGAEDKIQTVEMQLYPSERMLSGMLSKVITGVNLEGSRAVTPPPERIEEKMMELIKEKLMNEEGDNSTPPPLFKSEEAQTDHQAKAATDTDGSTSPPASVTPPPPAGPPTPRTPAAASAMQEFIEELKELAAWSNVEGIWKSKEERRDKREQCALKFWKKLLLNIHCENFTDLPGELEGTPSGALQFYVLQCQEYLKTKRLDWSRHMMRKGLMIHIERLVEAERMNGVVKDTAKSAFIHSFRCERQLKTIKKMDREMEELRNYRQRSARNKNSAATTRAL